MQDSIKPNDILTAYSTTQPRALKHGFHMRDFSGASITARKASATKGIPPLRVRNDNTLIFPQALEAVSFREMFMSSVFTRRSACQAMNP